MNLEELGMTVADAKACGIEDQPASHGDHRGRGAANGHVAACLDLSSAFGAVRPDFGELVVLGFERAPKALGWVLLAAANTPDLAGRAHVPADDFSEHAD